MSKLEGNGAARLVQLMRQHGRNVDVTVEYGTVISTPPSIKIRLENDGLVIDRDDITVAGSISDKLTSGMRVALLSYNNGQQFYLMDEAVTY